MSDTERRERERDRGSEGEGGSIKLKTIRPFIEYHKYLNYIEFQYFY